MSNYNDHPEDPPSFDQDNSNRNTRSLDGYHDNKIVPKNILVNLSFPPPPVLPGTRPVSYKNVEFILVYLNNKEYARTPDDETLPITLEADKDFITLPSSHATPYKEITIKNEEPFTIAIRLVKPNSYYNLYEIPADWYILLGYHEVTFNLLREYELHVSDRLRDPWDEKFDPRYNFPLTGRGFKDSNLFYPPYLDIPTNQKPDKIIIRIFFSHDNYNRLDKEILVNVGTFESTTMMKNDAVNLELDPDDAFLNFPNIYSYKDILVTNKNSFPITIRVTNPNSDPREKPADLRIIMPGDDAEFELQAKYKLSVSYKLSEPFVVKDHQISKIKINFDEENYTKDSLITVYLDRNKLCELGKNQEYSFKIKTDKSFFTIPLATTFKYITIENKNSFPITIRRIDKISPYNRFDLTDDYALIRPKAKRTYFFPFQSRFYVSDEQYQKLCVINIYSKDWWHKTDYTVNILGETVTSLTDRIVLDVSRRFTKNFNDKTNVYRHMKKIAFCTAQTSMKMINSDFNLISGLIKTLYNVMNKIQPFRLPHEAELPEEYYGRMTRLLEHFQPNFQFTFYQEEVSDNGFIICLWD